jgi:hypothetical protein
MLRRLAPQSNAQAQSQLKPQRSDHGSQVDLALRHDRRPTDNQVKKKKMTT